jgi:hypothetical protein
MPGTTVGRHAAVVGAAADPLIAAALTQRSVAHAGFRREEAEAPSGDGSGGLGWPGPDPGGPEPGDGGLGWPGDLTQDAGSVMTVEPAHARRGWRRFFRVGAAA